MISIHQSGLGLLLAVGVLAGGCSNDTSAIADLCASKDKPYQYCSCYVDVMVRDLSDQHLSMLADMARYQLSDGMAEAQARDTLVDDHGRADVGQFLAALASPQVEAELSCPQ